MGEGLGSVDTVHSILEELPSPLSSLPVAQSFLERPLRVSGHFFLECFCGMFGITLAIMMQSVPCICPWDNKFGPLSDVLKSGVKGAW